MLVRVKRTAGNYGHILNGIVRPKNWASGPFEVSDAKGEELVRRGIVDIVENDDSPAPAAVQGDTSTVNVTTPTASAPVAVPEMTIRALRDSAKQRGIAGASRMNKAQLVEALEQQDNHAEEEDAPAVNAADCIA